MRLEIYPQIKRALAESEAGKSLAKTSRWTQFRTNESNRKWREAIGATGQVLTHSDLFYHIAEKFLDCEGDRFTPEEQETFLYGIAVHDIGEAIINGKGVGDIGAYKKTGADEKKEAKIAYKAIDMLDLPQGIKDKLLDSYKQVVEGENPELHNAFKALEKTEYVLTAIKVFQNGKRLKNEGKHRLKYEDALVGRVLVYDLAKVLNVYAPEYPNSIGIMFRNAAPLVDEMFAATLPWLETNTSWMDKTVDHPTLAKSFKERWEEFKRS